MAQIRSANFVGDLHAPARARHFATQAIAEQASAADLDDAAMIISELVTNAVRAGASTIAVSIETDPDSTLVRFVVADDVAGWPVKRSPRPDEESGRGLPIVEALAAAWGVEPIRAASGAGKQVWATLATTLTMPTTEQ